MVKMDLRLRESDELLHTPLRVPLNEKFRPNLAQWANPGIPGGSGIRRPKFHRVSVLYVCRYRIPIPSK